MEGGGDNEPEGDVHSSVPAPLLFSDGLSDTENYEDEEKLSEEDDFTIKLPR